jgi:hypothetical protein
MAVPIGLMTTVPSHGAREKQEQTVWWSVSAATVAAHLGGSLSCCAGWRAREQSAKEGMGISGGQGNKPSTGWVPHQDTSGLALDPLSAAKSNASWPPAQPSSLRVSSSHHDINDPPDNGAVGWAAVELCDRWTELDRHGTCMPCFTSGALAGGFRGR